MSAIVDFIGADADLERAVRRYATTARAIGVVPYWPEVLQRMGIDISHARPPQALPSAPPPIPHQPVPSAPSSTFASGAPSTTTPPARPPSTSSIGPLTTVPMSPLPAPNAAAFPQQFDCVSVPKTDFARQHWSWPTPPPILAHQILARPGPKPVPREMDGTPSTTSSSNPRQAKRVPSTVGRDNGLEPVPCRNEDEGPSHATSCHSVIVITLAQAGALTSMELP
ncbi:hypothetical protein CF326_g7325 [Tilletia indica]|nr:hypothetical protein CF326_g7325 [Tilletia indica]